MQLWPLSASISVYPATARASLLGAGYASAF